MNNLIATYASLFLYLICTVLTILKLRQHTLTTTIPKNLILLIGLLGALAQCYTLYSGILDSGSEINLGFYNSLSLISAFITLFALFTTMRYATESLLVVILPIAMLTIFLDYNFSSNHLLPPGSSDALYFHVITSLVAYSILAMAALLAIMLSIVNRYLHNHQPGGFINKLPPIKTIECLLFEALTVGFICLTISLLSGMLFVDNIFTQQLAHKTILSIIAWFVFLILLMGRWFLGWRGRVAIRWTLVGYISLMLAYFGSKFVIEIILSQ